MCTVFSPTHFDLCKPETQTYYNLFWKFIHVTFYLHHLQRNLCLLIRPYMFLHITKYNRRARFSKMKPLHTDENCPSLKATRNQPCICITNLSDLRSEIQLSAPTLGHILTELFTIAMFDLRISFQRANILLTGFSRKTLLSKTVIDGPPPDSMTKIAISPSTSLTWTNL